MRACSIFSRLSRASCARWCAVGSGRIDVDRVDIYEFPTAAPAPAEASGTQSRV